MRGCGPCLGKPCSFRRASTLVKQPDSPIGPNAYSFFFLFAVGEQLQILYMQLSKNLAAKQSSKARLFGDNGKPSQLGSYIYQGNS